MINGKIIIRRNFSSLNDIQLRDSITYLKGQVDGWCKNEVGPFGARDLVGGINNKWDGSPLTALYDYYHDIRKFSEKKSINRAAIDVGWLLKLVVYEDKRNFKSSFGRARHGFQIVRRYQWVQNDK